MSSGSLGAMSIYELFRMEVDGQAVELTDALLALEAGKSPAEQLRTCMRCVHSLKGAARMVDLGSGVSVTHAMEECLVSAQQERIVLGQCQIDALLLGVDLVKRIAYTPEAQIAPWLEAEGPEVLAYLHALQVAIDSVEALPAAAPGAAAEPAASAPEAEAGAEDRVLRVSSENLNRLLSLAGESLVGSYWLAPFSDALQRVRQKQAESATKVDHLALLLDEQNDTVTDALDELRRSIGESQQFLQQRMADLELYARRGNDVAQRLYDEALACRMRPFGDGVGAFPRMVRDLAHTLGKQVTLAIAGQSTRVDRDILKSLEAPLTHLLRNAIDHGIETPEQRLATGKPAAAVVRLEAGHRAGMLHVTIADDGRGIDGAPLRARIVECQLTNAETAARLSEAELLEFLFLPGFTMKDEISEISGRGVGLDIVQHMVKQVRGSVQIQTVLGQGTTIRLQLPLTTSVVRALIAQIDGAAYAFPLAAINRALMLRRDQIEQVEGRQHFRHGGRQLGLVTAHQVLQTMAPGFDDEFPVILVGHASNAYGVVVDRLLGEHELVIKPLDPRLGKVKDIAAGALMDDGTPVLIIDVDDMVRSIDKLVAAGPLHGARDAGARAGAVRNKRILVVDDSLTVRELERKLLLNRGYEVEVAVDGMDGWNAARLGHFDLVITDIDMPRMDGIELVTLVKQHPQLRATPVMIVSYKDREEDRRRGLDAGADYYLTKGSFHDESLMAAVLDLIGEAGR